MLLKTKTLKYPVKNTIEFLLVVTNAAENHSFIITYTLLTIQYNVCTHSNKCQTLITTHKKIIRFNLNCMYPSYLIGSHDLYLTPFTEMQF